MRGPKRWLLFTAGWILVGLAVLGVVLPVLPTTPLLILAAACFVRSSEKAYLWILSHKTFGPLVKNYLEHRVVSVKAKMMAITTLWLVMGITLMYAQVFWVIKALIATIGLGVTWYLLSLRSK